MTKGDENVKPLIKLLKCIRMFCIKHASQKMIIRRLIKLLELVVETRILFRKKDRGLVSQE